MWFAKENEFHNDKTNLWKQKTKFKQIITACLKVGKVEIAQTSLGQLFHNLVLGGRKRS